MSDAQPPVTFERLLAHRDWVRSVARAIAYDAATADDLVQETWLEALRAPPRDDRNLRGWLGSVLRNRARKRGRSGARRAHHEAAAPISGPAPAAADVVAEAEAQQRIVAAVLALDEPYRTTVLLRFYEGLPPRHVGERMGVPSETVRTRVRRAAARLREALGGDGTDLSSWMGAVAPLLALPALSGPAAGTVAAGALAVHTKKTIAIATLAACLVGGTCAWVLATTTSAAPEVGVDPPPEVETAAVDVPDQPRALPERRRVTPPPPPEPEPVATPPEPEVEKPAPTKSPDVADETPEPVEITEPEPEPGSHAAKLKEKREKVRAKYHDDKGGFPFYDLCYWVDAEELDDARWSMQLPRVRNHVSGLQLVTTWRSGAGAEAEEEADVRMIAVKLAHERREGGRRSTMSYSFDNIGEAVKCSDRDALLEAFYEDWKRGAKDVLESRCEEPRKSRHRTPTLQAIAVGTEPESNERVRMEWYAWLNGKEQSTYVVQIRYGPRVWEDEDVVRKGYELMRNLREIRDKVQWDDDD